MSCVLRAGGRNFDVDAFMEESELLPYAIFRKGELKGRGPQARKRDTSGLDIDVSSASFDNFQKQVKDAVKFLQSNESEIRKLAKAKGLDRPPELDFGIRRRDTFTQSDSFPAELIALAGRIGLGITLSQYPIED